jgi:hypothetical protein
MTHTKLISLTLCALLLLTVGAGVVAAKTPQAGNSPIHQFSVNLYSEVVGKILVNTKQQAFVFNAEGLTPGRMYALIGPGGRTLGSAPADEDGRLHLSGTSVLWNDELTEDSSFVLSMSPPAGGYNDVIVSQISACYEYKSFWSYWNVHGYLTDQRTGQPLVNQDILIYQFTSSGYVLRSTEVTDDQGYFYYSRYASTLGGSIPISIIYNGDYSYWRDNTYWTVFETYSWPGKCP